MNKHHKYSPSSLDRLMRCPYSVKGHELESMDTPVSIEGTLLHRAVKSRKFDGLTDLQKELVQKCIDIEMFLSQDCNAIFKEKKLNIVVDNKVLLYGTADVVIVFENKVAIIDWKFGNNKVIETENNLQLIAYAVAAMQKFKKNICDTYLFYPRIKDVPEEYTFRHYNSLLNVIKNIIEKCEEENPKINPGEIQCQYCKLKEHLKCPALKNELQTIDKIVNLPELPDQKLIELYERAKIVNKFIDVINTELKTRIELIGHCGNYIQKEYTVKSYTVPETTRKKIVKKTE